MDAMSDNAEGVSQLLLLLRMNLEAHAVPLSVSACGSSLLLRVSDQGV